MTMKHNGPADAHAPAQQKEGQSRRKALGRGLESILPEVLGDRLPKGRAVTLVPITMLSRNPNQARQSFSKESIAELAQSLQQHGVLQPILVRPQTGGRYEIVAGERRWRAAQTAGLAEIPVIVRQISEKQAAEINLIENIHREDLNPIEAAEGTRRLMKEHGYTQEQLAERLCKSRPALANLLRLLDLPIPIQEMIRAGKIAEGHGRALLRVENERVMIKLAMDVAEKGLSVREAERLAAQLSRPPSPAQPRKGRTSPEIKELCDRLQRKLGTRVDLRHSRKGKGRLEIYYRNLDELDRILSLIFKK
jgi:ParB family chromosome partitioning protein